MGGWIEKIKEKKREMIPSVAEIELLRWYLACGNNRKRSKKFSSGFDEIKRDSKILKLRK